MTTAGGAGTASEVTTTLTTGLRAAAVASVERVATLSSEIALVAAPSNHEAERARYLAGLLREMGYEPEIDAIDDEHVWTPPLIDMRFSYRPENPVYLLLVRAYRLREPVSLANTPAYAGCKSWVPLDTPIDVGAATPALDDATYASRRDSIIDRVSHIS